MKHRSCHDCHKASEEVEIRQSDYLLCNACDEIRRKAVREMWANPKSPNPDPNNVDKTDNGLANKVASTADIAKKPTPSLNTNGATERPPPNERQNVDEPCSSSNCVQGASANPQAQTTCTTCHKQFHLVCVNLKKRPSSKTNWNCPVCKAGINASFKKLTQAIVALQETVTELKNNQRVLSDKHDLLQNENAQLKVQLSDMQETLGKLSKQTPDIPSLATSNKNVYAQKKTLILGDSMLRDVSASSLCNASVKSISGGTIHDIFQEIDQMAHVELSSYSDIIIHAGTNDISRKNDVQAFTDSMEAIITNIMFKSPTSSIHISAICPRSSDMVKVSEYNQSLKDLATRLTCGFIDIGPRVTYQDGTTDAEKFNGDGLHLSKSGTQILTNVFIEAVPGLKPVSETGSESYSSVVKRSRKRANKNQNNEHFHRKSQNQDERQDRDNRQPLSDNKHERFDRVNLRQKRYANTRVYHKPKSRHQNKRNEFKSDYYHGSDQYSGCWKCGLFNHNAETCFHKFELQCRSCHNFGHKANYCNKF